MSMTPHEIVDSLRVYAEAMARAAVLQGTPPAGRARLNFGASMLLEAADLVLQLQDRLVRQACYFEHIEAETQPKWPLLDEDDPGVAL
jgi:hypothetical protein